MAVNLSQVAKDKGIKYFLISFVDLFGVLRSKLVPARAIGDMQKEGAGFAGFAASEANAQTWQRGPRPSAGGGQHRPVLRCGIRG